MRSVQAVLTSSSRSLRNCWDKSRRSLKDFIKIIRTILYSNLWRKRSWSWWTSPMRRGCTPCLPRCAWRACCAGYSAGCSWSLSQQTETKWDKSKILMQNISGVIHLDSEISCQLPCVSVIFFLLKLNLMIICLLWRTACHHKTCSRAVWILLCHILTLLSSSTRLSSTKSTTLSSPILTTQGICENRFKTIKTLPLLSQPEAFIRNFGWFCCLAEHVLEFIFHLNYTIRNGYDRNPFPPLLAYSFHLPNGEFHFPLLLSKIQSPLKNIIH